MKKESVNLPFTDLSRFDFSNTESHIHYESDGHEFGSDILYHLQPGILLRISDYKTISEDLASEEAPEQASYPNNKVIIAFKLKGSTNLSLESGQNLVFNEGFLAIAHSDERIIMYDSRLKGDRDLMVMLMCSRDVLLESPFDLSIEELPHCIQKAYTKSGMFFDSFLMNEPLVQSLHVLLNSNNSDSLNRAFLQAKTLEIMCLALRNISQEESRDTLSKLSIKDKRILERAGEVLRENWQTPPSQDELVRILGIGKSKLKDGFRVFYGCTMTEFVKDIRLHQAQSLLATGTLNVTQVASQVGYDYTSNFTSAFKIKFGISPKAFQKTSL
jgi:AraC-like DNA-binding protein